MIYSRSAEYAIRAFVHLAQVPEGKYAMVKNIAEQEEIPAHFLAKILQQRLQQRGPRQQHAGAGATVDPAESRRGAPGRYRYVGAGKSRQVFLLHRRK